jgi:hypothetical protein
MARSAKNEDRNEEIARTIHAFSSEAFALAKAFVAGGDPEPLKRKAGGLSARVPEMATLMREADPAYRADLNRALSEARLDLEYVLAGGGRPSSMRMAQVIRETPTG